MPSINRPPKHRARLGRTGHDLSRRILFTSSVGHLLPVLHDFLSPGDKIRINERLFTRTQPVKTCAFTRATEYIEYFFVPEFQINPYFDNAFYGISDFQNSNDIDFRNYSTSTLGWTDLDPSVNIGNVPSLLPVFTLFDFKQIALGGLVIDPEGADSHLFGIAYKGLSAQYFDIFGVPKVSNAVRLLSMLGYGESFMNITNGEAVNSNIAVSPEPLCAYQKIWYDFYRRSDVSQCYVAAYNLGIYFKKGSLDYSQLNNSNYHGMLELHYRPFKRDYFTNTYVSPLFDVAGVNGYDQQQNGNGSNPNLGGLNDLNSYLLSSYGVQLQTVPPSVPTSLNYFNVSDDANSTKVDISTFGTDTKYLSTTQLRLAFAYEKLLQITRFAGKHVDDQQVAHFGVSRPKGISNEVYYLGGHYSRLQIGEVMATAAGSGSDGDTSTLGEIAGRGLGVSGRNRTIKFTAPCHGWLMAIYSCLPEVDYRADGVNALNTLTAINQFPRPEYDHLGMQPLLLMRAALGQSTDLPTFPSTTQILGWQFRYAEFKQSYDSVHGAFNYTLQDWVASHIFGDTASWIGNASFQYASAFYCPPYYLDNIFAVSFLPVADPRAATSATGVFFPIFLDTSNSGGDTATDSQTYSLSPIFERDPLLHSIDFDYQKSSFMSTYSLPRL